MGQYSTTLPLPSRNKRMWHHTVFQCCHIPVKSCKCPCAFFQTERNAMKACWGYGGTVPRILWPRHYMEMSGQLHALATLAPEKEPLVSIGQEDGWDPEPFWTRWREKFSAPAGNRTPEHRKSCKYNIYCFVHYIPSVVPLQPPGRRKVCMFWAGNFSLHHRV
jgi:hypothetical protein